MTCLQTEDFESLTLRFNIREKKLKRSMLPLVNKFVSIDIYYVTLRYGI